MRFFLRHFTNLYPIWTLALGGGALIYPKALLWLQGPMVVLALTLVMLGMGLNLTWQDFRRILELPSSVMLAIAAHYLLMPFLAWALSYLLGLDPLLALGLVLVGCCPTGTATNVVCHLAKANVALAVVITLFSTLIAFIITPLTFLLWAGKYFEIAFWPLCLSTLQMAFFPIVVGALLNWKLPRLTQKVKPYGPAASVLILTLITGSIVGANAEHIKTAWSQLLLATALLHGLGFLLGYGLARLMRFPQPISRTMAFGVGIQNSGLAMILARQHYSPFQAVALPSVFSAVIQSLLSGMLATWWRIHTPHSNLES